MSPVVDVKTLTIDGIDLSARADQTVLEVARENNIFIPTLCHLDGLSDVGACRLCLVELKSSPKLLPACVLKVEEGMEVHHQVRSAAALPADDPGVAVRRAQPRLFGLRGQQPLRAAVAGADRGSDARAPSLPQSQTVRRCLARALCRRPEPLHPLHSLRARLQRDRRRPCVGRDGPRHRFAGHHRPRCSPGATPPARAAASA